MTRTTPIDHVSFFGLCRIIKMISPMFLGAIMTVPVRLVFTSTSSPAMTVSSGLASDLVRGEARRGEEVDLGPLADVGLFLGVDVLGRDVEPAGLLRGEDQDFCLVDRFGRAMRHRLDRRENARRGRIEIGGEERCFVHCSRDIGRQLGATTSNVAQIGIVNPRSEFKVIGEADSRLRGSELR